MHSILLVFEFLGTTELLVIALVALILFGPRKLPEIGRTVGKSIAEFKRASDDFKRTWEFEVELEQRKHVLDAPDAAHIAEAPPAPEPPAAGVSAEDFSNRASQLNAAGETVARTPAASREGEDEDEINAS
jgi:TatA/E family protein of Tat protein translocase